VSAPERHHFTTCSSTNQEAADRAREGAPAWTVVTAEEQTAGRGRLDREWVSPRGNLHVSVVLRPSVAASRAAGIALVAAVATAEAIGQFVDPRELEVKWPNDVLLKGRKVAGILAELETRGDAIDWLVIGIGVNVSPPSEALEGALEKRAVALSSVSEEAVSLQDLCVAILERLQIGLTKFEERSGKLDPGEWSGWSKEGRRVRHGEGSERIEATALGITPDGALRLAAADGTELVVVAGDVIPLHWEE